METSLEIQVREHSILFIAELIRLIALAES